MSLAGGVEGIELGYGRISEPEDDDVGGRSLTGELRL